MTVAQLRRKLENMDPNMEVFVVENLNPTMCIRSRKCTDAVSLMVCHNTGFILNNNNCCSSSSINSMPMNFNPTSVIF